MTSRLDDRIRTMMQDVVAQSPPPPDLPTGPPPVPVAPSRFPNWAVALGAAVAVFVLVGGVLWLVGGPKTDMSNEPMVTTTAGTTQPPITAATIPTTTTMPPVPSTLVSATTAARIDGAVFDFADHDLCEWFASSEILTIVAEAYAAEDVDYPIPTALVAEPSEKDRDDRSGCDWTVPGTGGGWGRPDFSVVFRDDSDVLLADGTRILDMHKQEIADGLIDTGWHGIAADASIGDVLLTGGVIPTSGWSPGFYFYVESQDRSIDFRHDFAASIQQDQEICSGGCEDYTVEALIVREMLERMGWLATADEDPTTGSGEG